MGLTINPAVSGSTRAWLGQVGLFWIGTFAGALAATTVTLLVAGTMMLVLPDSLFGALTLVVLFLAVLADFRLGVRLPYRNRQVPELWRRALPAGAVAVVYGAMLGFGFVTLFTTSAHIAMIAALPHLQSLPAVLGAAALLAFGKTLVLVPSIRCRTLDEVSSCYVIGDRDIWILRGTTASVTSIVGIVLFLDLVRG